MSLDSRYSGSLSLYDYRTAGNMTADDVKQIIVGTHDYWPKNEWYADHLREVLENDRRSIRLVVPVTCFNCGSHWTRFGMWCSTVQTNGIRIANLRCLGCCNKTRTIGESKIVVGDARLPLWHDGLTTSAPCERCGSPDGTELHHWAPKHLFDDCWVWPTSYLCKVCHTRWHRIVTPDMNRKAV